MRNKFENPRIEIIMIGAHDITTTSCASDTTCTSNTCTSHGGGQSCLGQDSQ